MKKIIFILIVSFIVFLIYICNTNNKIYYVSFGESDILHNKYKDSIYKYVNYSKDDYRVMDLINDIKYNSSIIYEGKEYKIQNLLIKANLITISIGMDDLMYKKDIDYDYVDSLIDDINELLILIRKYNKDEIYFLSFNDVINNSKVIEYTNKRLYDICNKNNIKYVD